MVLIDVTSLRAIWSEVTAVHNSAEVSCYKLYGMPNILEREQREDTLDDIQLYLCLCKHIRLLVLVAFSILTPCWHTTRPNETVLKVYTHEDIRMGYKENNVMSTTDI